VNHRNRFFFVLAFGFVLLGMGVTVPGVTWPSVAESFGRSLAELGYVTLLFGSGYTVSSFLSGRLSARRGIGPLLIGAGVLSVIALTILSVSRTWPTFLIATGLLGVGGGLVDAATNTYVAIRRGVRSMGFIHGVFGVGAIAGPLLVTALLQVGLSWRVAFALLAVGQGMYVAGLWHFARNLSAPSAADQPGRRTGLLGNPLLIWSLVVFFVYAGVGAGAGVWAFTYLTNERGLTDGVSGLIVAGYWGAFTASRLILGAMGEKARPETVLRWSAASTAAAFTVLWWSPTNWLAAAALIFAGFSHGPIFPLEILLTARRFGATLTATVVGFEIAAANVGGALLPGLIGFAVGLVGLTALPPLLVANSLVLMAAIEILRRLGRQSTETISAEPGFRPGRSHP
jgi:fucose permease